MKNVLFYKYRQKFFHDQFEVHVIPSPYCNKTLLLNLDNPERIAGLLNSEILFFSKTPH